MLHSKVCCRVVFDATHFHYDLSRNLARVRFVISLKALEYVVYVVFVVFIVYVAPAATRPSNFNASFLASFLRQQEHRMK